MRALLATLAGIVALRVLGVTLLLAGFVEHARSLGATTTGAGLAFGAYPLALALFMLPLASLSDRVGRRPVMVGALAVSALGGVLAAFAPTPLLLGLARFVQGAGAVNGVALALVGELGAADRRTTRMAVLGAAAGAGAVGGILLGAWLTPLVGVPGLLLAHSAATLLLLAPLLARRFPDPPRAPAAPLAAWRDADALTLGVGALAVNLSLTGLLLLSPLLLEQAAPGVPYGLALTVMVVPGGAGMFVASRLADRGRAGAVGVGAGLLLALGPLAFLVEPAPWLLLLAGMAYFLGHSSASALLPSLAAAVAAEGRRGRAQGVQSTLQYLGSFLGSALMGALWPRALPLAVAFVAAGLVVAAAVARTAPASLKAPAPPRRAS